MKKEINVNTKFILYAGATALALMCGVQSLEVSAKMSEPMILMNTDTDIKNETAVFVKEDSVPGLVIEEKKAIDPAYIFERLDEQMYAKEIVDCKAEPKESSDTQYIVEKATEVSVTGKNNDGMLRLLVCGEEVYAPETDFTTNYYEIFDDCSYKMYAAKKMSLYEDTELTNVVSSFDQYEEVNINGQNDSGLLRVTRGDLEGYVKESSLLEYMPGELHIEVGNCATTSLYVENMHDGVLAEVPDELKTEDNIDLLARLIKCEAGGQTVDGKLAVATVVVNRCYDGYWGNTIKSVINAPGQFQPVSSGNINKAIPSEEDYECARKVLVEGYRSFPAYVMYFQSIKLGYFKGSSTYCICRDENGRWPQYFSYKKSDLEKYGL